MLIWKCSFTYHHVWLLHRTAVQATDATGSMGQEESELAFDSTQPGNSPDFPELTGMAPGGIHCSCVQFPITEGK